MERYGRLGFLRYPFAILANWTRAAAAQKIRPSLANQLFLDEAGAARDEYHFAESKNQPSRLTLNR
jgi:hypothetical protein